MCCSYEATRTRPQKPERAYRLSRVTSFVTKNVHKIRSFEETCEMDSQLSGKRNDFSENDTAGWGGRIRTYGTRYQKPLPYHLATPQQSEDCYSRFITLHQAGLA